MQRPVPTAISQIRGQRALLCRTPTAAQRRALRKNWKHGNAADKSIILTWPRTSKALRWQEVLARIVAVFAFAFAFAVDCLKCSHTVESP